MPRKSTKDKTTAAKLGFEDQLWKSADALRSNMSAANYKHVVLGLIFLKYVSDAFEELHAKLEADKKSGSDPEDKDEYLAENVFWVPKEARWSAITSKAKLPNNGKMVDDAMLAIERDNPTLKGVLPKEYAHQRLDPMRLGQLIDLIGNIGLGDEANRSKDILGRVYEYFLSKFASAEGQKGGQFYTPGCVVRLLVEMLSPYKGRVFDPACGSGGMFVQSEKFVEAHGGKIGDISIYGQESNHTTLQLAKMNLAIRGIDANLGKEQADSFHRDLHPDLRADYVMANPPFNDSDWRGDLLKDDRRWKYGTPPAGNANFAWVQHFIHHLAPTGQAGFVLANGSMSSNQSGEGEIRKNIVEADLVDCMVALPGQLFYSTQIPVCLWFLTRDKKNNRFRDRRGSVLFIDARKMGTLIDRVHRELTTEDIKKIADTYHKWRGDKSVKGKYADVPGFCKSATLAEIREHGHILTPGRYVGAEEIEDDVNASLRVHKEWDFDNWNGGTYSHAVYLTIPDSIYLPLIDRKDDIEKKLCSDLEKFNNCPNEHIGAVFLEVDTPSDQHWRENSGLLHPKTKIVSKDIENKIWEQGKFRVFLSHKSEDKVQVGMLRDRLRIWGIHAFVAHEDIEPTAEWQKTIENALATMDSFVALMTDKFHDSNWTDQEVGYAMGSGVPIIAVNLGINPYGFIGKYQAIKSNWEKVENDIVSQLKRVVSIPDFIHAMKESTSDVSCKNLARYLTCLPDLSEREIDRIIDAYNTNAALLDCCDFNGTNQHDKNGSLHSILQKHTRREIIQEMSKKMRALPLPQPSAKSQPYQPEMDEVPF